MRELSGLPAGFAVWMTEGISWPGIMVFAALLAFVAVFVGAMFWNGRPLRGEALDSLEKAVAPFKGTVDPGGWFRRAAIRCAIREFPAAITWGLAARGSEEFRITLKVRVGDAIPEGLDLRRVPGAEGISLSKGILQASQLCYALRPGEIVALASKVRDLVVRLLDVPAGPG